MRKAEIKPASSWIARCLRIIGGAGFFLAATFVVAETPQQADARGLRLVLEKRWREATLQYEQAVDRFPEYAPLRRNLANLYVLDRRPEAAIAVLQAAVELDPGHEGSWNLLRQILLSEERVKEWVAWAARWRWTTKSASALRALTGAHWRAGNRSQAEQLIRSSPALKSAWDGSALPPPSRTLQRLVLLVTLDTFRADLIDPGVTPALSRLARASERFADCTAVAPITLPAHASILTGLYPNRTGVRDNSIHRLPPQAETLAEAFQARGWATGAFVSAYVLDRRFGLDQGFATYGDRFAPVEAGGRFPEHRRAEETLAEAAAWLAGLKDEQAFLWVHLYDTHAPYDPPFPFGEAWPDRPYRGEAAYLDHSLGRFLDVLRASPLWKGTLVAVVGDHGESLGEHGEATHGFLLYQSTLHVPLLLKWPGQEKGMDHSVPVSQVDLCPTLLEWLGGPDPSLDGESLRKARPGRLLHSETQIPLPFRWSDLYRVRRDAWTYTGVPADRWHDLEMDPREIHPLPQPLVGRDLLQALETYRTTRPRWGKDPVEAPLDDEALARLRSLGYVHAPSAAAPAVSSRNLPDPERKMEALTLYQRALETEEKGDLETLAERARALAAAEADNPALLAFAAEWLNRAGDDREAVRLVDRALALDPRYAQALFYRGFLREGRGDRVGAVRDYEAALREQPGHFLARYNLSRILLMSGAWIRAEAEMRAILERLPNHAYTLNNLAYLAMKRDKDCGKALELAQRANQLKPGDAVLQESLRSLRSRCRP